MVCGANRSCERILSGDNYAPHDKIATQREFQSHQVISSEKGLSNSNMFSHWSHLKLRGALNRNLFAKLVILCQPGGGSIESQHFTTKNLP